MGRKITFLQINDTHGYLEPHPELFWENGMPRIRTAGGFARIRSIFQRVREECDGAVVALDNGDTFHGTFHAVHSRGEALIAIVNLLGLDAWTAHWDFAYGVDRLNEIASRLNYPLLASNAYRKDAGEPAYPAYTVVERAGIRVGIVGIAATIIDKTMPAHFSEGLRLSIGNQELPLHIRTLRERERVDLIAVLSHLGFPQDVKLATEAPGIDLLFSGHTHNRMYAPMVVNGALIIQSGCHGSFVGRLDVELSGAGVANIKHELIPVGESVAPDAEMHRLVENVVSPYRGSLSEVVGQTATVLHRNTMLEATMDNLLLQAVAEAAGTTVAFSNGWRYGSPIPPGAVTLNDLWNIIPVNPPLSVVELTGAELRTMMEENLEHTFAADPYRQMGGYAKRCLGLNIYAKLENPAGARIQEFFVERDLLDPARKYAAAFVTSQAVPGKYGRNRHDLGIRAIDALKRYFSRHGEVISEPRGSIIAV